MLQLSTSEGAVVAAEAEEVADSPRSGAGWWLFSISSVERTFGTF